MLQLAMHASRAAIWSLGAAQCAAWGVLYYGFAVWNEPLQSALALSPMRVAAAFSFALLIAAMVAPRVGRLIDQGRAATVMRAGIALGALGLSLLSRAAAAWEMDAAWACIGLAMGLCLYEPAFGLIGRAIPDHAARLRALSAVTVLGGLASTLFLPLLAGVALLWGWRQAVLAGVLAVLAAGLLLESVVFRRLRPGRSAGVAGGSHDRPDEAVALPHSLALLFAVGTFSAMAMTVLLVPLLTSRHASPVLAASVLGLLGVSQLPGRLWLLRAMRAAPVSLLTTWPLALQGAGLMLVAAGPVVAAGVGVVLFGIGAGLHTLARPWLVQRQYGSNHAGRINGRIARVQGYARAAGPIAAATAAGHVDASAVFAALGMLSWAALPLAAGQRRSRAAMEAA